MIAQENDAGSFLSVEHDSKEHVRLSDSLIEVYKVFSKYKKPRPSLTCLDYGPTAEERAIFQRYELSELPNSFIETLEFYDSTWSSWGTEEEVKYFLPRILDRIAIFITNEEEFMPSVASIIYKLNTLDSWGLEEAESIKSFFRNLFFYAIHHGKTFCNIDTLLDFIFLLEDELSIYIKFIEALEKGRRNLVFKHIFENCVQINHLEKFSIKYGIKFPQKKESLIREVLESQYEIIDLDFLIEEPWYQLLLHGIQKD